MRFNRKFWILIIGLLAACAGLPSCTKKEGAGNAERYVNLAVWSNYVIPETLAKFTQQTGIKIRVSNFSSNEELLAKLQAGASGFDVIVPSDYMVFTMSKLGLLAPLDHAKIPNERSIYPKYLKKKYDPDNKYSLPLDWGTTGIALNRDLFQGKLTGWKGLFNNPELKGKISLLDDPRETIGAALKSLGFSLNSKNPEEIDQAKTLLISVRGRVKAFNSETKMALVNSEIAIAHAYMTDALGARKTNKKIEYFVPEEGGTFWVDNLAIPATSPHQSEAHELVNFLIEGQTVLTMVVNLWVAPTNQKTFELLPSEIKSDRALFQKDELLAKSEMIEDLGEALTLWDRAWTEIKARKD